MKYESKKNLEERTENHIIKKVKAYSLIITKRVTNYLGRKIESDVEKILRSFPFYVD